MMFYAGPVARLVDQFAKLPGIGPKTAQRLAFYILNAAPDVAHNMARALVEVRDAIQYCPVCQNLTDESPCHICRDPARNREIICVVEESRDVVAMEKARGYKGLYHVLHGAISPLEGVGPDDLKVKELLARLQDGTVKEIVLATNPTVEGDATAMYLARLLQPVGLKVTRIAHGLPVGADLEYADAMTLNKALEGRQEIR